MNFIYEHIKKIESVNGSPHARLILKLLFFEKSCRFNRFFRLLRVLIVQGIYHVEIDPRCLDIDGICSLRLPHPYNIIIHGDARIGSGCTIFQNVTIGAREKADGSSGVPFIGNGVFVGAGSVIVGGVKIGDEVRIGALSCILRSVESGTVAGLVK